jgi:malate dehydrogenase (oxaloacetate-decarboxylating)(NADP+)
MWICSKALAEQVTEKELNEGCLYPPLRNIRQVSAHIAVAVAKNAHATGVATEPMPDDLLAHVKSLMYDPFEDPYEAATN